MQLEELKTHKEQMLMLLKQSMDAVQNEAVRVLEDVDEGQYW